MCCFLPSRVRDKLMIVVCFLIEMLFVYLLFQQPFFIRIMFLVSEKHGKLMLVTDMFLIFYLLTACSDIIFSILISS